MPIIIAIIEALIDGTLIAACLAGFMALIAALSMLGALGFVLAALAMIIKAIRGTPDKVIRRRYINHDGREVIEEIPHQPVMGLLTGFAQEAAQRRRELTD